MTTALDSTAGENSDVTRGRDGRPLATLSIDVDNTWAYRRAAGHSDWEQSPTILPLAITRMVDRLTELDLPLTAFLVGRDLLDDGDVSAIEGIQSLDRWELANHSWNHLPWLHTLPAEDVAAELDQTSDAILDRFGVQPVGFRGPGFSCPPPVRRLLAQRGYWYDASVFPTSLAPVARAVFLAKSNLRGAEREKAKQLYGGWSSMLQPNRPHAGTLPDSDGSFWRIPVTTLPLLRTPIHLSYVTFLACQNVAIAKAYVRTAFWLCRKFNVVPSLLLHPPDFLGGNDTDALDGFPGMSMDAQSKLDLTGWILALFAKHFDVRTMAETVPSERRGHRTEDNAGAATIDAGEFENTTKPSDAPVQTVVA